jgi:hypothetical protein
MSFLHVHPYSGEAGHYFQGKVVELELPCILGALRIMKPRGGRLEDKDEVNCP